MTELNQEQRDLLWLYRYSRSAQMWKSTLLNKILGQNFDYIS